ncbi:MAG: class I SAM-dependent methyltransferase [Rickettsiales bacterium]|jgi:25S rRNA (uracil2634-N3)-methyltransferase
MANYSSNTTSSTIRKLGVLNQIMICKSLDFGLVHDARKMHHFDKYLAWLLHKSTKFDFVAEVSKGRTLLVGEGNFSFALNLAKKPQISANKLVATTFETENNLSEEALANVAKLKITGAMVLYGVDATKLHSVFGSWLFDNIIFQFPHVGSRDAIEGHNPNFILVRDFLVSAKSQLQRGGQVLISAVNTPHYHGAFQFEEAAKIAGFKPPEIYKFDPNAFPEYEHTMTHQSGSALDNHDKFSTFIFKVLR